MNIQKLEWDSNFFNISIGKLELDSFNQLDFDTLKKIKIQQGFDLIYLFLKQESEILQLQNAFLADRKVIFHKTRSANSTHIHKNIEEFEGNLTSELLELVLASGNHSRFKSDPKLSPKFEELYQLWIEKSITGELADKIFVAKADSVITGFVTVKRKDNFSQIGLIAVSEYYKGKGIGRKLLETVDWWNNKQGIEHCEVATQLDNTEACAFYKKLNYSIKTVLYIYHL